MSSFNDQDRDVVSRWGFGPEKRLDALLKRQRISSVRIAKALSVSGSLVSKWRNGTRTPDAYELGVMVALANGSTDDILGIRPSAGLIEAMLRHVDQAEDALRQLRERAKAGALTAQQAIDQTYETAERVGGDMQAVARLLNAENRRAARKSGKK